MSLSQEILERSITANAATAGAAEQTVDLSLDGAAAAAAVNVPADEQWEISDLVIEVPNITRFLLQQSNDNGANWFNVWIGRSTTGPSKALKRRSPVRVDGIGVGASQVQLRLRAETTGGAGVVRMTLGVASQKNGAIVQP